MSLLNSPIHQLVDNLHTVLRHVDRNGQVRLIPEEEQPFPCLDIQSRHINPITLPNLFEKTFKKANPIKDGVIFELLSQVFSTQGAQVTLKETHFFSPLDGSTELKTTIRKTLDFIDTLQKPNADNGNSDIADFLEKTFHHFDPNAQLTVEKSTTPQRQVLKVASKLLTDEKIRCIAQTALKYANTVPVILALKGTTDSKSIFHLTIPRDDKTTTHLTINTKNISSDKNEAFEERMELFTQNTRLIERALSILFHTSDSKDPLILNKRLKSFLEFILQRIYPNSIVVSASSHKSSPTIFVQSPLSSIQLDEILETVLLPVSSVLGYELSSPTDLQCKDSYNNHIITFIDKKSREQDFGITNIYAKARELSQIIINHLFQDPPAIPSSSNILEICDYFKKVIISIDSTTKFKIENQTDSPSIKIHSNLNPLFLKCALNTALTFACLKDKICFTEIHLRNREKDPHIYQISLKTKETNPQGISKPLLDEKIRGLIFSNSEQLQRSLNSFEEIQSFISILFSTEDPGIRIKPNFLSSSNFPAAFIHSSLDSTAFKEILDNGLKLFNQIQLLRESISPYNYQIKTFKPDDSLENVYLVSFGQGAQTPPTYEQIIQKIRKTTDEFIKQHPEIIPQFEIVRGLVITYLEAILRHFDPATRFGIIPSDEPIKGFNSFTTCINPLIVEEIIQHALNKLQSNYKPEMELQKFQDDLYTMSFQIQIDEEFKEKILNKLDSLRKICRNDPKFADLSFQKIEKTRHFFNEIFKKLDLDATLIFKSSSSKGSKLNFQLHSNEEFKLLEPILKTLVQEINAATGKKDTYSFSFFKKQKYLNFASKYNDDSFSDQTYNVFNFEIEMSKDVRAPDGQFEFEEINLENTFYVPEEKGFAEKATKTVRRIADNAEKFFFSLLQPDKKK